MIIIEESISQHHTIFIQGSSLQVPDGSVHQQQQAYQAYRGICKKLQVVQKNTTSHFSFHAFSIGDWFVLYQMNKNMNKRFFAEFVALLSMKVKCRIYAILKTRNISPYRSILSLMRLMILKSVS